MIDQDLTSTNVRSVNDPPGTEAELLAGCREGKRAAWDALFDKYYGVAARFVFQLSGDFNHEDTEEICQETFLAVVRNLDSFKGKSSFQTWLLRIAANKAMDFREKTRAAKRGGSAVHISLDGNRDEDSQSIDRHHAIRPPMSCCKAPRHAGWLGRAWIDWVSCAGKLSSCVTMAISATPKLRLNCA